MNTNTNTNVNVPSLAKELRSGACPPLLISAPRLPLSRSRPDATRDAHLASALQSLDGDPRRVAPRNNALRR
jgi:hypothetical protein